MQQEFLSNMSAEDLLGKTTTKLDNLSSKKAAKVNRLAGTSSTDLTDTTVSWEGATDHLGNKVVNDYNYAELEYLTDRMNQEYGIQPDGAGGYVKVGDSQPFEGNTGVYSSLYRYASKNPNYNKIGIWGGHNADDRYAGEKKGYENADAYGKPIGEFGVDRENLIYNRLLPRNMTRLAEGLYHGSTQMQQYRPVRQYESEEGNWDRAQYVALRDAFGSGATEFYNTSDIDPNLPEGTDREALWNSFKDKYRLDNNVQPTFDDRVAFERERIQRREAEEGMGFAGRTENVIKGFGLGFVQGLIVDPLDAVGDATGLWDLGDSETKQKNLNEFFGYNPYIVEEAFKRASEYTTKIYEDIEAGRGIDIRNVFGAVYEGLITPEILSTSFGHIGAMVFPLGRVLGATKLLKTNSSKAIEALQRAEKAKRIEPSAARAAIQNVKKDETALQTIARVSGDFVTDSMSFWLYVAGRTNNTVEAFKENNNGQITASDVIRIAAVESVISGIDRVSAGVILRNVPYVGTDFLKRTKEIKDVIPFADQSQLERLATGASLALSGMKKVGGATVVEGGQEALQSILESVNEQWKSAKYGDDLAAIVTDKENVINTLTEAAFGMGMGATMSTLDMGASAVMDSKAVAQLKENAATQAELLRERLAAKVKPNTTSTQVVDEVATEAQIEAAKENYSNTLRALSRMTVSPDTLVEVVSSLNDLKKDRAIVELHSDPAGLASADELLKLVEDNVATVFETHPDGKIDFSRIIPATSESVESVQSVVDTLFPTANTEGVVSVYATTREAFEAAGLSSSTRDGVSFSVAPRQATHVSPNIFSNFDWKTFSRKGSTKHGAGTYLSTSEKNRKEYEDYFTRHLQRQGRKNKPATYNVSVGIDGSNSLNWGNKLNQQSQTLRNLVATNPRLFTINYKNTSDTPQANRTRESLANLDTYSGDMLYRALAENLGSPAAASEFLADNGIVGAIVPSNVGDGSSNYVIYDDSVISIDSINYSTDDAGQVLGFTYRDKVYLVADNMDQGTAAGIVMHEVGVHLAQMDVRLGERFQLLVNAVKTMKRFSDPQTSGIIRKAESRVEEALGKRTEANAAIWDEELVAYTVEEAVNAGITPQAAGSPLEVFLQRVLNFFNTAIRAVFESTTADELANNLTLQGLVDITHGFATATINQKGGMVASPKFSSKGKINFKGKGSKPKTEENILQEVIELVTETMLNKYTGQLSDTVTQKLKNLAETNSVPAKVVEDTILSYASVREESVEGNRGTKGYAKQLDDLLAADTPNKEEIQKLYNSMTKWYQTTVKSIGQLRAGIRRAEIEAANLNTQAKTTESMDLRPREITTEYVTDSKSSSKGRKFVIRIQQQNGAWTPFVNQANLRIKEKEELKEQQEAVINRFASEASQYLLDEGKTFATKVKQTPESIVETIENRPAATTKPKKVEEAASVMVQEEVPAAQIQAQEEAAAPQLDKTSTPLTETPVEPVIEPTSVDDYYENVFNSIPTEDEMPYGFDVGTTTELGDTKPTQITKVWGDAINNRLDRNELFNAVRDAFMDELEIELVKPNSKNRSLISWETGENAARILETSVGAGRKVKSYQVVGVVTGTNGQPRYETTTRYKLDGVEIGSSLTFTRKGKKETMRVVLINEISQNPTEYLRVSGMTPLNTIPTTALPHEFQLVLQDSLNSLTSLLPPLTEGEKNYNPAGKSGTDGTFMAMDSPARALIFNKEGNIDESMALAMGVALRSVMANSADLLVAGRKSAGDVERMFGIGSGEASKRAIDIANQHGQLLKHTTNLMGKAALGSLGIRPDKSSDVSRGQYERLVTDLGNMIVEMGVREGILNLTTMSSSELSQITGEPSKNLESHTTFVGIPAKIKPSTQNLSATPTYAAQAQISLFRDIDSMIPDITYQNRMPVFGRPRTEAEKIEILNEVRNDFVGSTVPEQAVEAMKELMDTPYSINMSSVGDFLAYFNSEDSRDAVLNSLGFVEINENNPKYMDMLYSDKAVQEAKNRAILKSIQELEAVYNKIVEGKLPNRMFFDYFYSSNHRLFMDTNTLNPQTNKTLHRFLVTPQAHTTMYNVNRKDNTFSVTLGDGSTIDSSLYVRGALAQAFGVGIDKKETAKIIEIGNALLSLSREDVVKLKENVIEAFQPNNNGKVSIVNNGRTIELEPDNIGHTFQALTFLEDYKTLKGDKVRLTLSGETDALTSGFAIKAQQYGSLDSLSEHLARVGVIQDGKLVGEEAFEGLGDSYGLNDILSGSMGKLVDSYQNISLKSFKEMKQIYNYFSAEQPLLEAISPLAPLFNQIGEDNLRLDSQIRNMFKPSFMIFNYSAGFNRIAINLSDHITEIVLNSVLKLDESNVGSPEYDSAKVLAGLVLGSRVPEAELVTTLQTLLKTMKEENIKVIGTETSLFTRISESVFRPILQEAISIAFTSEFRAFVDIQNATNDIFAITFAVFNKILNDKILTLRAKGKKTISEADVKKAIEELHEVFPSVAGPLSEAFSDNVFIYDTDTRTPQAGMRMMPPPSTHFIGEDGKKKQRVSQLMMTTLTPARSAGSVTPIHAIDGAQMVFSLMDFAKQARKVKGNSKGIAITPVHDAGVSAAWAMDAYTHAYNSETVRLNTEYSLMDNLVDLGERVLKYAEENNFDLRKVKPVERLGSIPYKDRKAMGENTAVDLMIVTNNLKTLKDSIDSSRADGIYTKNAKVSPMVGFAGSVVTVGKPQKSPDYSFLENYKDYYETTSTQIGGIEVGKYKTSKSKEVDGSFVIERLLSVTKKEQLSLKEGQAYPQSMYQLSTLASKRIYRKSRNKGDHVNVNNRTSDEILSGDTILVLTDYKRGGKQDAAVEASWEVAIQDSVKALDKDAVLIFSAENLEDTSYGESKILETVKDIYPHNLTVDEVELVVDGEPIAVVLLSRKELIFEDEISAPVVEAAPETTDEEGNASLLALNELDSITDFDYMLSEIDESLKDNPCGI